MPKITRLSNQSLLALSVAVVLVTVNFAHSVAAQVKMESTSFTLTNGVVVDSTESVLYLMNPAGGIDAIELLSGRRLWHTEEAAKPMRVDGDLVIAQADRPTTATEKTARSHFEVVVLNARDGRRTLTARVDLPDGVWSGVDDGLGSSLKTQATRLDGSVVIQWQADMQEVRGIAPSRSASSGELQLLTIQPKLAGAVRLDLQTGQIVTPVGTSDLGVQLNSLSYVSEDQRIPNLAGAQYISSNGRHLLVSEMTGDDSDLLHKYRWTIYSLATKERIGAVSSPFSTAPFFVSGSTLIYEAPAYSVRNGDDRMSREILKVRSIDLLTGAQRWALPLRDTAYRGPFPP